MAKNKPKKSILSSLRNNFIAGVVVLIPIGIRTTIPAIKLLRSEDNKDFFGLIFAISIFFQIQINFFLLRFGNEEIL